MKREETVDWVIKWCYINLNDLVLVKHENLFKHPAVTDLQALFNNRFLKSSTIEALITKDKRAADKMLLDVGFFLGHCLRIVKEKGEGVLSSVNGNTKIKVGDELVPINELLPDCIEIQTGDFHVPVITEDDDVKILKKNMKEVMKLEDGESHDVLAPQEAQRARVNEAFAAVSVNMRPFQPRKTD